MLWKSGKSNTGFPLQCLVGLGICLWLLSGRIIRTNACAASVDQLLRAFDAYKTLQRVKEDGFVDVELDGFEICGLDFSTHKKSAVFDIQPLMSEVVETVSECTKLCLANRFKARGAGAPSETVQANQCNSFQFNSADHKCLLFNTDENFEKLTMVRNQYSNFFQVHELHDQNCDNESSERQRTSSSRELVKVTGTRNCSYDANNFVFRKIENYTMDIGPAISIPEVTEKQCADFCRYKEKLATIRIWNCYGATYNKPRGVCYLFDAATVPQLEENNVAAKLPIYNSEYVYYDRICVLDDAKDLCLGYLETFPQKVLIGFNQQVETVMSFEECAESCIFYNSQVPGSCRSAMYYPEEEKSNCLLNFGDHINEPIFFLDQTTERTVFYFSLRLCYPETLPVPPPVQIQDNNL